MGISIAGMINSVNTKHSMSLSGRGRTGLQFQLPGKAANHMYKYQFQKVL